MMIRSEERKIRWGKEGGHAWWYWEI